MGWDVVPWGFNKLLCWIHEHYAPKGGILAPCRMGCGLATSRRSGT